MCIECPKYLPLQLLSQYLAQVMETEEVVVESTIDYVLEGVQDRQET